LLRELLEVFPAPSGSGITLDNPSVVLRMFSPAYNIPNEVGSAGPDHE